MKIIPLSELRNTKILTDLVFETRQPVFVTKQGASHIVIMQHDEFVKREEKIQELEDEIRKLKKTLN